jgi:hypothetical protein
MGQVSRLAGRASHSSPPQVDRRPICRDLACQALLTQYQTLLPDTYLRTLAYTRSPSYFVLVADLDVARGSALANVAKIVISYRRDDSAATVGRIYDRLVIRFGCGVAFNDIDAHRHGLRGVSPFNL